MKLKLAQTYSSKFKKGDVIEIDNIMRDRGESASGVQVRVIGMFKTPTWLDLGWFVPPVSFTKRRTLGRK